MTPPSAPLALDGIRVVDLSRVGTDDEAGNPGRVSHRFGSNLGVHQPTRFSLPVRFA